LTPNYGYYTLGVGGRVIMTADHPKDRQGSGREGGMIGGKIEEEIK